MPETRTGNNMGLLKWISEGDNRRHIRNLKKTVDKINALEPRYQAMSDDELKDMTRQFRERLAAGETLDQLLPEAYAVVRETGKRVIGQRHYDVQLMGGIVLHQGRIAEMKTGEGKTLTETLPAYLNALAGNGVHIVTVNDYLAKRDAEWMGKIPRFLGMTVGVVYPHQERAEKQKAYQCDITYGTNNELGFDYLRDNMVVYENQRMQRGHAFCIVDEVDSILIDEARTPLIISGKGQDSSGLYLACQRFVRRLRASTNVDDEGKPLEPGEEPDGDYEIDLKKKAVSLTSNGIIRAETDFGLDNLADAENSELNHYINNALRANFIMKRDSDYIVKNDEVIIVDEFTGRQMPGRRYSDGLHQAIEAKENVRIQSENKTLATVTFQNYFRLYSKLSGMTGTAKTEETEFKGIYGLDVVVIPPNRPLARVDQTDYVFASVEAKLKAIIADIEECQGRGQPVLVGTTNVEKSEELSRRLRKLRIPHNVLNAKNHEKEADIVAQAGRFGAITIATNMAGRGTDILLGGNPNYLARQKMKTLGYADDMIELADSHVTIDPEGVYSIRITTKVEGEDQTVPASGADVLAAREEYRKLYEEFKVETDAEKIEVEQVGGLRIIGTERHESRRIDNQLRGRAGRQGDIGSSRFYLSVDDEMIRVFGGERIKKLVEYISGEDETPIDSKMLTGAIEMAQKRLEGMNYSRRLNVLEYDNVMNVQRKIIYGERNNVLEGKSVHEKITDMMKRQCRTVMDAYVDPKKDWNDWDCDGLNRELAQKLVIVERGKQYFTEDVLSTLSPEELTDTLEKDVIGHYEGVCAQAEELGFNMAEFERSRFLQAIDQQWMDHIDDMSELRQNVGLYAYGQQDPVIVYKKEGFEMFEAMMQRIRDHLLAQLTHIVEIKVREPIKRVQQGEEVTAGSGDGKTFSATKETIVKAKTPQRNDPCPCGATWPDGTPKKYKDCCGKTE